MAATRTRSPRRAKPADPAAPLSPEVRWYLRDRGYSLPRWCRPLVRTPEPRDVTGAVFDPARVDRVIAALRRLRHTQGKWAGRELTPDAWQVAYVLAPVFGWTAPDEHGRHVRIVRNAYVEIARKNGKTTLAAGLALYLAFGDREPGAQVLAVAASRLQARQCFDPAALITTNSPELRAGGVRALRNRIQRDADGSYFAVASSVGDLIHGTNLHGAVVDELWAHKTRDVLDAVESGTGARDQPLVVIITTAGTEDTETAYAQKRDYVDRLARGSIADASQYGVVFAAPEGLSPWRETTWRRANPGYGASPTRAFLAAEARKAQQSPVMRARFERLHLGRRRRTHGRWIDLDTWDRNAGLVREADLAGRACWGGLDLAATSDLTALCWDFPAGDGTHDAIWRLWAPEARLRSLDDRTAGAASEWVRSGLLRLTPGEVTDYSHIRAAVNADRERYDVREIAYDPWGSSQLVTDLLDDGAPMVTHRQGYASMSPPMKDWIRLLASGTAAAPAYRHGGNPCVRWQVDHLVVDEDAAGNVKPSKSKSSDKIDATVAAVMALARASAASAKPARSKYEDTDLIVVGDEASA
jgi:phage terminase large subunit-like protein